MKRNLFEKILYPHNSENFLKNYYGKNLLHIERSDSLYYNSFFSIADADKLINSNLLLDRNLKISKVGSYINKDDYFVKQNKRNVQKVKISSVLDFFHDNASIVIDDISSFNKRVLSLEIDISQTIGFVEIIFTNLYVSPKDSQAFSLHYDTQEVIILQIAGSKKWKIFNEFKDLHPIDYSFEGDLESLSSANYNTYCLSPGDFLYIPRGMAHEVLTTEEPSLHLTISIIPYTLGNLYNEIISSAIKEKKDFRISLSKDYFTGNSAIYSKLQELFLDENFINDVKSSLINKNNYKHFSDYSGFLNDIFNNSKIENDQYAFRSGIELIIDNDQSQIRYGTKELLIDANLSDLSDIVASEKPFTLNDLDKVFHNDVSIDLINLFLSESMIYKVI